MDRLWKIVTSMRTSAVILAALAALMVLNVVIPQEATSPEAFRQLVSSGPWGRFWLETVGLGDLPTSRVFLLVLAAFFLNLVAVLGERTAVTLRRARATPPTPAAAEALLRRGTIEVTSSRPATMEEARRVLEGLGFRPSPVGERALWAVKNPAAVLGFPLFHLAFLVLSVGGAAIYYTRQVAAITVTEGQAFSERDLRVLRRAPWGGAPETRLALERVDLDLQDGLPTRLEATLRSLGPDGRLAVTGVNHPASWGPLSVLVTGAGLSPVIALRDGAGRLVDRVAVVVKNRGTPTTAALAGSAVEVTLEPVPVGPAFPEPGEVGRTPLRVVVREAGREVFRGRLPPRTPLAVGDRRLEIDDVRYWASLYLVHERGGGAMLLGFALLVVGTVWRMAWFRREVIVAWGDGAIRLGGRGEFYPARFAEELDGIRALLQDPATPGLRERKAEDER